MAAYNQHSPYDITSTYTVRDVIPPTVVGFPTLLSKKVHPCDLYRSIEIFFQGVGEGRGLLLKLSQDEQNVWQNASECSIWLIDFQNFPGAMPQTPPPLDLSLHCACDYSKAIFHSRALELDTLYWDLKKLLQFYNFQITSLVEKGSHDNWPSGI